MAIEITLDSITDEAQDGFPDVVVPLGGGNAVTLLHPFRLSDEKRDELNAYFKSGESEDDEGADDTDTDDEAESAEDRADAKEQVVELLAIVAETTEGLNALCEALGDDLTKYQAITKLYMESVQPGEA